ncbi:MAG TPA: hypothetical protein VMT62_02520 [Syntrophorhabdaceae bacterium]|nr:hypothetical protein [Syntrophorhabdaceae bacterium]
MKKKQRRLGAIFMGLLFLACLTGSAYGGAGRLSAEPLSHDFGVIDEGATARVSVTLTNVGDADLTITEVRTN